MSRCGMGRLSFVVPVNHVRWTLDKAQTGEGTKDVFQGAD